MKCQLLASTFYEALRHELRKAEANKRGSLLAATDQCPRSAAANISPMRWPDVNMSRGESLTTSIVGNVRFPQQRTCPCIGSRPSRAITGSEQVQHTKALLDDLVGELLEAQRYIETKCLGGSEIDHQLVFHGSLDGKLARLLAPKDARGVGRRAPITINGITPV